MTKAAAQVVEMRRRGPAPAGGHSPYLTYKDEDGEEGICSLRDADALPFETFSPRRRFPSYRGQPSLPGRYYFTRKDGSGDPAEHVVYESLLEKSHLIALDFDPDVIAVSSQPFRLQYRAGGRWRKHTPDFFARLRDGGGRVLDVKGSKRAEEPKTRAVFAATRRACRAVGWEYQVATELDPTYHANLRWLAGFRREVPDPERFAEQLVELAVDPTPLGVLVERVGGPATSRPVLYHLLWNHLLTCDLTQALKETTVITTATRRAS